jgi:hypothetical protein
MTGERELIAKILARFEGKKWDDIEDKTHFLMQDNSKQIYLRRADKIITELTCYNCEYNQKCENDEQKADYCPLTSWG